MSALPHAQPFVRMECEPVEKCALCGSEGTLLYSDLKDYLFGAEGSWNMRRCADESCGLLWIDPLPLKSEIGKAYQSYYTHSENNSDNVSLSPIRKFAYDIYELTLRLSPIARQRRELAYMFLDQATPGRLLEVGSGNGERLALFRHAGWEVEGTEVDADAARRASAKYQIPIRNGELHNLEYSGEQFDAVIMNHVLEHVHDPLGLISECFRLVRPGGVFVSATPNSKSFGHARFKRHWVGLDPPRHLHLFNESSLLRLVESIPARRREVWTSAANAELFCGWSVRVQRSRSGQRRRLPHIPRMAAIAMLQYGAAAAHVMDRSSGEECILRLTK